MYNSIDENILEDAIKLIKADQKVVIITVLETWGSSPRQIGSKMVVSDSGNISGSVSGGCIESSVIRECKKLLKEKKNNKILEFNVSDENAWNVGLTCGGKIKLYLDIVKK
tara:strand:+ start:75 stop:407 length:333 start_codon:yes stop_codon:yes gene_type:complete